MATTRDANWTVRAATFVLWAAAAASAVYWGLKVGGSSRASAAPPVAVRQPAPDAAAIARLLGQGAGGATSVAAAPAASRYQLVGVVSDASRHGAALIIVEGRPAKPYRVGAVVDEGIVLQSVAPRRAVLAKADGGAEVATLEMPAPGAAQR
ncbi:type II secretion system protein N [Ramlibacter algicola]|uniref:General secretion pathway protein C n=1 Tax=Ramlibacter algicola TaxID=2795217 RepID=A0A934PZD2_9BURK|nr:type II secretion system protein N [Ramlibacter algicola]MBK0391611.1 general secretion pathway protein C [Ramlibacter algicola]